MTARIVLRPDAGALEAGEYRLVIDRAMARPKLAEADGSPWSGLFFDGGSFPVVIRALDTAKDRARHNAAEALHAMRHEDYAAVLEYFRRMAAATPGDVVAETGIGWALLLLGRFAEAAAALEQVWTKHRTRFAGARLATAYAALGRDDLAESLVRQVYPSERAEEELQRVRQEARTLRSRRR